LKFVFSIAPHSFLLYLGRGNLGTRRNPLIPVKLIAEDSLDGSKLLAGSSVIESQIMRLRRWLSNEKVSVDLFYLPFIEVLIKCLAKQTLVLAIDGSTTAKGCIKFLHYHLFHAWQYLF
jgi:hypothetical protein